MRGPVSQPDPLRAVTLNPSIEWDRCSCDVVLETRQGHVYNEEAFQHLLGIERRLSERSRMPFLLVLIAVKKSETTGVRIESVLAEAVFSTLAGCLRETDIVGWFREGRLAGALISPSVSDVPAPDVSVLMLNKVNGALRAGLAADVADRLLVRVYRLSSAPKDRGESWQ